MNRQHKKYYYDFQKMKGNDLNHYIAGFVDGEGSFSVSFKKQEYKFNPQGFRWLISASFQVYQHGDHLDILNLLKDFVFETGRIHKKTSPNNVWIYSVENTLTLKEKIIPFFRRYPLAVKNDDFQKFSEIVSLLHNKAHLTKDGFVKIVNLAYSMNAHGKQRKRTKAEIINTLDQQFLS